MADVGGKIVSGIKGQGNQRRVNLVEPNAIARIEGKIQRIIDERPEEKENL